jgi:hypothetical protein
MSKDVTIKRDTIKGKVVEQKVYKYQSDTIFIKKQKREKEILDSILNKKKK